MCQLTRRKKGALEPWNCTHMASACMGGSRWANSITDDLMNVSLGGTGAPCFPPCAFLPLAPSLCAPASDGYSSSPLDAGCKAYSTPSLTACATASNAALLMRDAGPGGEHSCTTRWDCSQHRESSSLPSERTDAAAAAAAAAVLAAVPVDVDADLEAAAAVSSLRLRL